MEVTQLPLELLAEIIVWAGPQSLLISRVFYEAYLEYRAIIRGRWLLRGLPLTPTTVSELRYLIEQRSLHPPIPWYPSGVNLLMGIDNDLVTMALTHRLIELPSHAYLHVMNRPQLFKLIHQQLETISVTVANSLALSNFTPPDRDTARIVYAQQYVNHSPTLQLIDEVCEEIRARQLWTTRVYLRSCTINGSALFCRLTPTDYAWFISFVDREYPSVRHHLTILASYMVKEYLQAALEQQAQWSLSDPEWHRLAMVDLEATRQLSRSDNLYSLTISLHKNHQRPYTTDLTHIDEMYQFLYVRQWPRVRFSGLHMTMLCRIAIYKGYRELATPEVLMYYSSWMVSPGTVSIARKLIDRYRLQLKCNWPMMIWGSMIELINHSPDGSYTSWYDKLDCDSVETLPRTAVLNYLLKETTDRIVFEPYMLNLPPTIYRQLRPRLIINHQSFTDDELIQYLSALKLTLTYVIDRPNRWPPNGDGYYRRSTRVSWSWIHLNNLPRLPGGVDAVKSG